MVGEMVCCLSWLGMVSELGLLSWAQDETAQVYLDMDSTPSSIATSVYSAYVSPNDPNEILVSDVEVDIIELLREPLAYSEYANATCKLFPMEIHSLLPVGGSSSR